MKSRNWTAFTVGALFAEIAIAGWFTWSLTIAFGWTWKWLRLCFATAWGIRIL